MRKSPTTHFLYFSLLIVLLHGCRSPYRTSTAADPKPRVVPRIPLHSADILPVTPAQPTFREVGLQAGLDYRWEVPGKRPLNILQTIGNGCAFLDYDNDGNLDILLVGPRVVLYKGDGHGHFTDVSHAMGLDRLHGHFLGCCVGDYDNDGWKDIYLSGFRTGVLLHNEQGKGFRDVTAQVGLKPQVWGASCAFADLDRDGYLDLYICNYVNFDPATDLLLCPFKGVMTGCGPNDYQAAEGVLYHNEKGRRFTDITSKSKLRTHGKGLGVAFADFNRSGRVSFAVANDLQFGDLYENQWQGKFENIGAASGTGADQDGQTHAGMGIDWGDYDNDGLFDLFVTTFRDETKCLYHNDGHDVFHVVSAQAGIDKPTLPYVGWGCKFFDADNDGWLDLIIANGHVQDNISRFEKTTYREPTLFLHNQQGKPTTFLDATKSAGLGQLPLIVGRGLAVGDYDNDGKVDVLVVDSEGRPLLLHNEIGGANHWLGLSLIGTGRCNRDAYGAVVTFRDEHKRLIRQCHPGGSYLSSSDPRVHVGLGQDTIKSVTVLWPDGKSQTWTDLDSDRYYTVKEGEHPQ
jgi:hypothetical protein